MNKPKTIFNQGDVVAMGEKGGPDGKWDYPQIHARFLKKTDLLKAAQDFAKEQAEFRQTLANPDQSPECIFASWLVRNEVVEITTGSVYISLTEILKLADKQGGEE
jgi:hypothetical protein